MKKHFQLSAGLVLTLAVLLSACTPNVPTATSAPNTERAPATLEASSTPVTVTATTTPDPCAPENIEAEVMKVHKYMREFDDTTALATNLQRDELVKIIPDLQRIRREAQDQVMLPCLGDLKAYQLHHMNTVIDTMIALIGGTNSEGVNQGILLARQQHDQYTLELARLLGITVEAAPTLPLTTETPATPVP